MILGEKRPLRALAPIGLGLLCLVLTVSLALAERPRLLLEPGGHTAAIPRLAVDEAAGFVVTVSSDRSLRYWSLADGSDYGVRRPPLGSGRSGQLRAVDVRPRDGAAFFVASDETGANGHLYRIRPEEGSVSALFPVGPLSDFTFDGATGHFGLLSGRSAQVRAEACGGFLLNRSPLGQRFVAQTFGPGGLYATASAEGRIEVTQLGCDQPGPELVGLIDLPADLEPLSLAISPDGSRLAVGMLNRSWVDLYAIQTGERLRRLEASNVVANGNLGIVTWASDPNGRAFLYAGGTLQMNDSGLTAIVTWREGEGAGFALGVARDSITDLRALSDGGVLFASTFPSWGRLAPPPPSQTTLTAGRAVPPQLLYDQSSPKLDFRYAAREQRFGLAAKGALVSIAPNDAGGEKARVFTFDLEALTLSAGSGQTVAPDLYSPSDYVPGVRVTDWYSHRSPKVNGQRLTAPDGGAVLGANERSLSVDIAPDGSQVLLGADFSLNLLDREGRLVARRALESAAWAVALVPDAPLAVAALGDGTLRWYALDGVEPLSELAAVFIADDAITEGETSEAQKRWIAWRQDGYFTHGSYGGEDLAGYQINALPVEEGGDRHEQGGRWLSMGGLYRLRHRPSLVSEVLARPEHWPQVVDRRAIDALITSLALPSPSLAGVCTEGLALGTLGDTCAAFDQRAPGAPREADWAEEQEVLITLAADESEGPVTRVQVYRNGGLTGVWDRDELSPSQNEAGTLLQVPVSLVAGANDLSLQVFGKEGAYSDLAVARLNVPAENTTSRLFILAVGIADYLGTALDLSAPPGDAELVTQSLIDNLSGEYHFAEDPVLLLESDASSQAIGQAIDQIAAEADANDAVVIYLGGHGETGDAGYAFIPQDVSPDQDLHAQGISDADLIDSLSQIKARSLLLLLDTCYAGAFRQEASDQLAHDLQHFLITATGPYSTIFDTVSTSGRGMLAEAFAEGVKGLWAQEGRDVDVLMLGSFLMGKVAEMDGEAGQQSIIFRTPGRSLTPFPLTRGRAAL
ncbi:MAG: caspase family protein [Pseudomonadota bacterium]